MYRESVCVNPCVAVQYMISSRPCLTLSQWPLYLRCYYLLASFLHDSWGNTIFFSGLPMMDGASVCHIIQYSTEISPFLLSISVTFAFPSPLSVAIWISYKRYRFTPRSGNRRDWRMKPMRNKCPLAADFKSESAPVDPCVKMLKCTTFTAKYNKGSASPSI